MALIFFESSLNTTMFFKMEIYKKKRVEFFPILKFSMYVIICLQTFREGVKALLSEMNDVVSTALRPPGTLKEYSQFLADFQAANYDQDLELPGQYTGLHKPLPELHVRINSFDERVNTIKPGL